MVYAYFGWCLMIVMLLCLLAHIWSQWFNDDSLL